MNEHIKQTNSKLKVIINPKPLYVRKPKRYNLEFYDDYLMIGEKKIPYESIRLVALEDNGRYLVSIYLVWNGQSIKFGIASFLENSLGDIQLTKQVEKLLHALRDKDSKLASEIAASIQELITARKKTNRQSFLFVIISLVAITVVGIMTESLLKMEFIYVFLFVILPLGAIMGVIASIKARRIHKGEE